MADFLSFEDARKGVQQGGQDFLSFEEARGIPQTSLLEKAAIVAEPIVKPALENFKNLGDLAGMALAMPGMAIGSLAGYARQAGGILSGSSRRDAATAGLETSQGVTAALDPVGKIKELIGVKSDSDVAKFMEGFADRLKQTGIKVESQYKYPDGSPMFLGEDVEMFANSLMGMFGAKGTKALIDQHLTKPVEPPKPVDVKTTRQEVQDQIAQETIPKALGTQEFINESLLIRTDKAREALAKQRKKEIKKAFKDDPGYPESIMPRQEQVDPTAPMSFEEAIAGEKVRQNIPIIGEAPPAMDSAINKVREGKAFALTAEEKIAMQDIQKGGAGLLDQYGKPLAVLAAAGISAELYMSASPQQQEQILKGAGLLSLMGAIRFESKMPIGKKALAIKEGFEMIKARWPRFSNISDISVLSPGSFAKQVKLDFPGMNVPKEIDAYHSATDQKIYININGPHFPSDVTPIRVAEILSHELTHGLQKLKKRSWKPERDSDGHIIIDLDEPFPWESEARQAQETAVKALRKTHEGSIDPKLLAAIGLGGAGALAAITLDPEHRTISGIIGAIVGAAGSRALPGISSIAKHTLAPISTEIGSILPEAKLALRKYEMRVLTRTNEELHNTAPLMHELKRANSKQQKALERALLTGDRGAVNQSLLDINNPKLTEAWKRTRETLDRIGEELQGHGRFKTMLDDYFPRLVKDKEGLFEYIGKEDRTMLEETLLKAERKMIRTRGSGLTSAEESSIINAHMQGYFRSKGHQPGFAKARGIDVVTEELQKFYYPAAESLNVYIRGAVKDLELARFFGKDLAQTKKGKQTYTNVDLSIGNLVGRALEEKRITPEQARKLEVMLQSRFHGGEQAASKLVQDVRNLGSLGLIGNVVGAATQLGDVPMASYAQGFVPTLTALARQVSRRQRITAEDFGLVDHIADEFVSKERTAAWLSAAFKYSGFSHIDRFGKTVMLESALERFQQQVKNPRGIEALRKEYGKAYGDEFSKLVSDLKKGEMSEPVQVLLFSELADMQPITKSEMPKAYLDNPNGRVLYMLKTFTVKQLDIVRRDVIDQLRQGNIKEGLGNATKLAIVLGLAGATTDAIKDWMLGRPVSFDMTSIAGNVLKTYGWSEYVLSKAAQGKPLEAVATAIVPPYRMLDDAVRADPKAIQYIPLVGRLLYSWEFGGKEKAEIKEFKKSGRPLSPSAVRYLEDKKEALRMSAPEREMKRREKAMAR